MALFVAKKLARKETKLCVSQFGLNVKKRFSKNFEKLVINLRYNHLDQHQEKILNKLSYNSTTLLENATLYMYLVTLISIL